MPRTLPNQTTANLLVHAAGALRVSVDKLEFEPPIAHVYNPLTYAWVPHEIYLRRFGAAEKKVVFLGMNPGPFGMVQTGVPFGEITAVREWLKIESSVSRPKQEHPKRPILGFNCHRSEVSGRRLWGLFRQRFGAADNFFRDHIVLNYCPLAFLEETGRNRTPDKLPSEIRTQLLKLCDEHLRAAVTILNPTWVIGIGDFAAERAKQALAALTNLKLGQILHPSPANPAANRDWTGTVTTQLKAFGIW